MPSCSARTLGLALLLTAGAVGSATAATTPQSGQTTLQEALALAYANNPTLQASRAQLRATDENVSGALGGWRPQVSFIGQAGIYGEWNKSITARPPRSWA